MDSVVLTLLAELIWFLFVLFFDKLTQNDDSDTTRMMFIVLLTVIMHSICRGNFTEYLKNIVRSVAASRRRPITITIGLLRIGSQVAK